MKKEDILKHAADTRERQLAQSVEEEQRIESEMLSYKLKFGSLWKEKYIRDAQILAERSQKDFLKNSKILKRS